MGAARTEKPPGGGAPTRKPRVQRFRVKIITMGNANAGKSALITRWCKDKFSHKYDATVGVDHAVKMMRLGMADVRVNIWDLGGAPEFFEIRNEFYKDAQAAVLVYDVCNRDSFEALDRWRDETVQFGGRDIIMLVAATKCDLRTRYVSREEGEAWAAQRGCPFFEVSAQSGAQVSALFATLLVRLLPTISGMPQDAIEGSIKAASLASAAPRPPPLNKTKVAPRPSSAERAPAAQSRAEDEKPASFSSSYSFSHGARPPGSDGAGPSASMRRMSQEEVEARMQERKAEWTQEQREREHQQAAREAIRDKVKRELSRVEAFTDLVMVLKLFGYPCNGKEDVKRVFRNALIEMHPDKLTSATMEEAVRKEEMFKILMSKKHLL